MRNEYRINDDIDCMFMCLNYDVVFFERVSSEKLKSIKWAILSAIGTRNCPIVGTASVVKTPTSKTIGVQRSIFFGYIVFPVSIRYTHNPERISIEYLIAWSRVSK